VSEPLRVAIVGAGPAGIYAADLIIGKDQDATVDIFDRLPTPYGLIRYGVAPDHPRIKQIIVALHRVMDCGRIRFLGNVHIGVDVKVDELREFYDAIIFATGADRDRSLHIPGEDLPRSHGAADFVSFYDSHPDREQVWDLSQASSVAVVGAGNVALDVARMLARPADELSFTDIPAHVHAVLASSAVTDVHMFARRGPAQARFTPVELRDLDHSPNVQVVVAPEGMEFDEESEAALSRHKSLRMVVDVLSEWAMRDPSPGPHRRIHIHFLESPVEVLGDPQSGVTGLRTERQMLCGDGTVRGTGKSTDWDVQAVYRAVGYRSEAIEDLPFDPHRMVLPNDGGRLLDLDGVPLPGLYATGWIKRGPVGLIGHTKSDAAETVAHLMADLPILPRAPRRDRSDVVELLLAKSLPLTDFAGWDRLEAHERISGAALGRERLKVHTRGDMTRIAARAAADIDA
jgi:ferredoxin/flavodoxin---NADP+ reductase